MESLMTLVVIIILVGGTLASFKYPAELYLSTKVCSSSKIRNVYYACMMVAIFCGTYAMGGMSISIIILLEIPINFIIKLLVYFIAFVVEVIGNCIYIKVVYGGIKELIKIGKSYEDDENYLDNTEEDDYDNEYYEEDEESTHYCRNNNIVNLQDYKNLKKR